MATPKPATKCAQVMELRAERCSELEIALALAMHRDNVRQVIRHGGRYRPRNAQARLNRQALGWFTR